jgi:hypothetical protein
MVLSTIVLGRQGSCLLFIVVVADNGCWVVSFRIESWFSTTTRNIYLIFMGTVPSFISLFYCVASYKFTLSLFFDL